MRQQDGCVTVAWHSKTRSNLEVSIHDKGPGVAPEIVDCIFERLTSSEEGDWASDFPFAGRLSKGTAADCGSSEAAPTERNSIFRSHSGGRNCPDSRSINRFLR